MRPQAPIRCRLPAETVLFLDEVGELPLSLQPKLQRALQQGEVQWVGADRFLQVNVRVVAATNRDLRAEVAAGRFRADVCDVCRPKRGVGRIDQRTLPSSVRAIRAKIVETRLSWLFQGYASKVDGAISSPCPMSIPLHVAGN